MELIIIKASEIFADTNIGLTGTQLIKRFVDYAIKFDRNIPHKETGLFIAKKVLFMKKY